VWWVCGWLTVFSGAQSLSLPLTVDPVFGFPVLRFIAPNAFSSCVSTGTRPVTTPHFTV
jgi:hypothetical protein